MPLRDYPKHEFLPHGLTKAEIADPSLVLASFFDYAHLPQHREEMRTLLNVLAIGNFGELSSRERADLVHYHRWLEKLVEATHIIHERQKK